MKTLKSWLCAALLCAGANLASAAVPGDLDTTYGYGGISRQSFGDLAQADDLVVDRLGNVYTAGTSTTAGVIIPLLTKYKPDGTLDTSFGSGGFATPAAPPANVALYSALTIFRDTLYQLIAADDKLYVYAFNTNGVSQSWFGSGGVAVFTVGNAIYPVFDIAQWGNYLGIAASAMNPATGNHDFVLVQLSLAGGPVAGFGSGGIAYSRLWSGVGARNRLTGLTFQPDGRIVAAGRTAKPGEPYDFVAARYRLNGTPDPTFGLAGFSTLDFGAQDFGRRVSLRKDGSLVVAGSVCKDIDPTVGSQYCFAAATAFKSDGSLDTGFGASGRFVQDVDGGGVIVTDLVLDERERPILVGQHLARPMGSSDPNPSYALIMRVKRNGWLDTSYLGGGWADFSYGYDASANGGVQRYPGGLIVTAGTTMKLVAPPSTYHGLTTTARHVN